MGIRSAVPLLAAALLLTVACGERLESRQRHVDLSDRLREFTALIRWGYFDAAAGMQLSRALWDPAITQEPAPDAPPAPEEAQLTGSEQVAAGELSPIRITSFEHVGQTLNQAGDEAYVVSVIDYYRTETQTLRKLRYRHTWWYHSERERWFLDSELPNFE